MRSPKEPDLEVAKNMVLRAMRDEDPEVRETFESYSGPNRVYVLSVLDGRRNIEDELLERMLS